MPHSWNGPSDPDYSPGRHVYGYTCPWFGYYGEYSPHHDQSVYGYEPYGGQLAGYNITQEMMRFVKPIRWGKDNKQSTLLPLLSIRATNGWHGRAIFQKSGRAQRVRLFTPWDGSPKPFLFPWSLKFMEAQFLWQLLDPPAKRILDIDANKQKPPGVGVNFFTRLYMKDDERWRNYV